MLIILPPSESKRPAPDSGSPLALRRLSFSAFNPIRERLIDALIDTSRSPDAFERLRVRPSKLNDVLTNTDLRRVATQPAAELYTGALHQGFGWSSLSGAAQARCARSIVIASPLWGLVRPLDEIPSYRLHMFASLIGVDRLDHVWRDPLSDALDDVAGPHRVVLDLRSPEYQSMGTAAADRTVSMRVLPEPGERAIGNVIAKRVRGQVARHLVESGAKPFTADDLADALSDRWPVRVEPPGGPRQPWTLLVRPSD